MGIGTRRALLRNRLRMGEGYEADEYAETILDIDGVRYGNGANSSLIHTLQETSLRYIIRAVRLCYEIHYEPPNSCFSWRSGGETFENQAEGLSCPDKFDTLLQMRLSDAAKYA